MSKKMAYPLKDQSGVALVLALIMIVILTLIGLASTYTSTFEMKLSGNKRGTTDAFYAADACDVLDIKPVYLYLFSG